MSTEKTENFVDPNTDDLDAFNDLLHGRAKPVESTPEPASSEEVEDQSDDKDNALLNDATHSEDEDTLANEDDSDKTKATDKDPEPKPKSRFQERIDELTGKAREAERREQELARRLEEAIQKLEAQNVTKPEPKPAKVESTGPTPEDTNEDGSEKYPLGEFDPRYIRDLTRFTINEEREAIKAAEAEEETLREMESQREALNQNWVEKLGPAQERYPDFQEKGQNLVQTFENIDQAYGEYLSSTLMSMDYGPDVLYYLANNIDEATKIVNMGATKATIALGRLESKFADADVEKQAKRPKVSNAPIPPPTNKGSAAVNVGVPDDTDDLDAFAAKFFAKKRRS